jgi:ABC-type transporter Mla maintaining outer membrane lipid asymmetry permease subunit MlaE
VSKGGSRLAFVAILVAGGVGIYDLIHTSNRLRSVTFDGTQIDHVGWGLYVVVGGAVIALIGLMKGRSVTPRSVSVAPETDEPSPR